MSWSKEVISDMVSTVAWDDDTLMITWRKSGRVSAYAGVDEETALKCANAGSVGGFVNNEIKPNYAHSYIG